MVSERIEAVIIVLIYLYKAIELPPKKIDISENMLDPSYWLTDNDINAALQLIRTQWPDITAQDSLLIQRQQEFERVVKHGSGQYVQVSYTLLIKYEALNFSWLWLI